MVIVTVTKIRDWRPVPNTVNFKCGDKMVVYICIYIYGESESLLGWFDG